MMAPTHKDIQNAVAHYIYNALSLRIHNYRLMPPWLFVIKIIIICVNVHTAHAKAKYAHNHVTAESAQPRNRSKCARPSPVFWVGSGHETTQHFVCYLSLHLALASL